MNDFIDGVLDLARPEIQKTADPIRLPDDGHSFSQRIIFLTGMDVLAQNKTKRFGHSIILGIV